MLITSCNIVFFFIFRHPLPLVITLIFQTLIFIYSLFSNTETPWIRFITFLIYLGGLLIIFTYLSAIIPNEIIFTHNYIYILLFAPPLTWLWKENRKEIFTLEISQYFRYPQRLRSVTFFFLYILLVLCILIYLCNRFKTPLKQENY